MRFYGLSGAEWDALSVTEVRAYTAWREDQLAAGGAGKGRVMMDG